jgi:hypothetical protein
VLGDVQERLRSEANSF